MACPRGFIGPNLLAMVLFDKFGQHQPLNRQSERYGREGTDLFVSTLANQVGAATAALAPLNALIKVHVMAAERLHADDNTMPIIASGKTDLALQLYFRFDAGLLCDGLVGSSPKRPRDDEGGFDTALFEPDGDPSNFLHGPTNQGDFGLRISVRTLFGGGSALALWRMAAITAKASITSETWQFQPCQITG